MSVIGKKTQRRSDIPMKMVTMVKDSKKDYKREKAKADLKKATKKYK